MWIKCFVKEGHHLEILYNYHKESDDMHGTSHVIISGVYDFFIFRQALAGEENHMT